MAPAPLSWTHPAPGANTFYSSPLLAELYVFLLTNSTRNPFHFWNSPGIRNIVLRPPWEPQALLLPSSWIIRQKSLHLCVSGGTCRFLFPVFAFFHLFLFLFRVHMKLYFFRKRDMPTAEGRHQKTNWTRRRSRRRRQAGIENCPPAV